MAITRTTTQAMQTQAEAEAVDWCLDCFDDAPMDLTAAEAVDCVQRQYPGGMAQFCVDVIR